MFELLSLRFAGVATVSPSLINQTSCLLPCYVHRHHLQVLHHNRSEFHGVGRARNACGSYRSSAVVLTPPFCSWLVWSWGAYDHSATHVLVKLNIGCPGVLCGAAAASRLLLLRHTAWSHV
jgi:hypothetical protein